ncbi:hypothetical protein BpHYR1_046431, partial [Brachionus plicatilis]
GSWAEYSDRKAEEDAARISKEKSDLKYKLEVA